MPVTQVGEYSDTVPEGMVIRITPEPGSFVFDAATEFTEYVSLGPEPDDGGTVDTDVTINLNVLLGGRMRGRPNRRRY